VAVAHFSFATNWDHPIAAFYRSRSEVVSASPHDDAQEPKRMGAAK
jgi:hypothetical protein